MDSAVETTTQVDQPTYWVLNFRLLIIKRIKVLEIVRKNPNQDGGSKIVAVSI